MMCMKLRFITGINSRKFFIYIFSLFILSCSPNSDVNKPVDLLWDKLGEETDSLIIFLPGLYDTAETFKKEQFFTIARKAGIKADMVAASIHLNHLLEEMMVTRLEIDIFKYARSNGYHNIWLVGISLGSLNSLLFYRKHAKDICGVVALAPYLANKALIKEIQQAGGIKNWQSSSTKNKKVIDQKLQFLWVWLQEQDLKNNLKQIYLGYGKQDQYVESIKILEGLLHKKNVTAIEGGHKLKIGRKLWQRQLLSRSQTGLLQPCK